MMTQESKHFVDLLRHRAMQQPDRRALVFLEDREGETTSLTYGELDFRARAIASQLIENGGRGERVLLMYPPGLDYVTGFIGCLYAGAIAVPAYPPHPSYLKRTLPRFRAIAADSKPGIALTTAKTAQIAKPLSLLASEFRRIRWLATDTLDDSKWAPQWQCSAITEDTLAFIQYTSGSTAAPKGVMVSHANLLHNSAHIYRLARHSPESVYVSWLPTYHDMGLIGGILQPLFGGFLGVLMSPVTFLKRPFRWLQAISQYRGTTSPFPNFALDLCVRKVTPDERKQLDLRSWALACNGAEPIQPDTLRRFTEAFQSSGFRNDAHYPAYGIAEGTLLVTGAPNGPREPLVLSFDRAELARGRVVEVSSSEKASSHLLSCGQSVPDQRIAIVNPDTGVECPSDQVGEIWVSGPSVAQGYWNKKEETERVFHARLAQASDARTFLRTGDLGFLRGEELFITGRIKDLIIIRGRNVYPQDIEQTVLESNLSLRPGCCAAFSLTLQGEEVVGVVVEYAPSADVRVGEPAQIMRDIRSAISLSHELDPGTIVLLKAGTIPKTSSGKIQRHACLKAYKEGSLEVHSRWKRVEEGI